MADDTKADNADWFASMLDHQAELTKRAVAECNRLRRRVGDLEAQLAAGAVARLMEQQDRITMLEQLLSAVRTEHANLEDINSARDLLRLGPLPGAKA